MAEKTAEIEFNEFPGEKFIVRISPIPMDEYLSITEALDSFKDIREMVALADRFYELAFVGWEGRVGEATPEGFRHLDMNLILGIMQQWSSGVAKLPLPLPVGSANGGPSKARRASKSPSN